MTAHGTGQVDTGPVHRDGDHKHDEDDFYDHDHDIGPT